MNPALISMLYELLPLLGQGRGGPESSRPIWENGDMYLQMLREEAYRAMQFPAREQPYPTGGVASTRDDPLKMLSLLTR